MYYYNPNYSKLDQYVVKQNDSLYLIAKKYGITVEDLMNTNHLVSTMIYPNQILFIPSKKETVVKSNDGMQNMIHQYNSTLKDISNYKGYSSAYRDEEKHHMVQMGETVEDIMSKHQLSPIELLKLNECNWVVPGGKVIIKK